MYALNSYSDLIFPPPGLFLCIDSQFFPMILNTFPPPLWAHLSSICICMIYCLVTYQNYLCQNKSSNRLHHWGSLSVWNAIHQRFVSGKRRVVCKCRHFNPHMHVRATKSVLCSFLSPSSKQCSEHKWNAQGFPACSHLCWQLRCLHSNLLGALNCNLLRLQLVKRPKDNCLNKRI